MRRAHTSPCADRYCGCRTLTNGRTSSCNSCVVPVGERGVGLFRRLVGSMVAMRQSPLNIKQCHDHSCGWLFLDRSHRHDRKWCSAADCDNRARARAHYHRHARRIAEPTDELLELLSVLGRIVEPGLLIRHPIGYSALR
jgi:predicted RNA-binding Zn ribbon-like protein